MRIYFRNNPAKFCPDSDPVRNDRAMGFFEEVTPRRFQEQEQQHMRSVPDLKMEIKTAIVNRLYLIMFLL